MTMKWTTKDGEKIGIKEMTDSHLLNTVKFIERNTEKYVNNVKNFYLTCVTPSGEMASILFDREFDEAMELCSDELLEDNTKYQAMLKEVKRRKLQ